MHNPFRAARPYFEIVVFLLTLALAAYLRLANLADNPGWFSDEGTHIAIAQELLRGRVQYLALNQSTLLVARPPLFEILLAGVMRLGGEGMGALRALTGVLGVASVGVLYLVVRRMSRDTTLALLAALMLAMYPQAVLYSRFGFSYNLLTPLALLASLGLWEYLGTTRRRWLTLAAFAVGVGGVSDLLMLAFAAPLLVAVSVRRWRDGLWAALLMALPFAAYSALMLALAPRAFLFDLRFTLLRLNAIPLNQQLAALADNFAALLRQDLWMAAGLIGLFLIRPVRLRWLSLLFLLLPLVPLGRTVALYSLSAYYLIPLLPFAALGVAALIRFGARRARETLGTRWGKRRAVGAAFAMGCLLAAPFVASVGRTAESVRLGFVTPIDDFLVNPDDARRAAEFVNAHTRAADLVIASPATAWLFRARAADFQMAVAATGQATVHLPADLPPDRFAFDPRLTRAQFVVVDNLWRNWAAVHMPAVAELIRQAEAWPLVLKAGQIEVYRNPKHLQ